MYLCGNRYRVIGRLGEGGFGDVYLAEDRILKKTWAIKDIGESDRISYSLVRSEVSVLAKVSHPGIVRITDVFRSDGHIYIVMDHIKGMNLKELMNPDRKLSEKMLFKWSAELCDAISYLHHMNPPVILCDIKPQNIMVKPDGHIVLIDFGAAIPYASDDKDELSFISRGYASPEQLRGDRADIKSEI
ncbi:MAG: serine/threonine protein kinase, partial [Lachnospiraceae bacterium]|nr:serine/threonine protein kinase [Lachnospiraceae bacterium]